MRKNAIRAVALAAALAGGVTACHGSGSGSPAATSAAAAAREGAAALATSPALQHDEFAALRKLQPCAAKQGLTYRVTSDPAHPVRLAGMTTGHMIHLAFHPWKALERASACAAPPSTRASVKACVKRITLKGGEPHTVLQYAVVQVADCIVGAPQ